MNGGRSPLRRLRIGVYNRFWPTAGGGEKFAGGIAQALAELHDVELIGHDDTDRPSLDRLADRLQLDLSRVGWRSVGLATSDVEAASADYDLFINVSYGSTAHNRAPLGLYIVHFPTSAGLALSGWRRAVSRVAGRLARLTRADLGSARWVGGLHGAEPLGPLMQRWTDGDGLLHVVGGGRMTVVLGRGTCTGRGPVTVELRTDDGTVLGATTVGGTSRRSQLPLSMLRAELPAGPGPLRVHVVSPVFVPEGSDGDRRRLGATVVAAVSGPWHQRLLQAVTQPVQLGAADLGFLDTYQQVAANSLFTAEWVRRLWGLDPALLNPPVSAQPRGTKEPVILHVGRFFPPEAGHCKRQREMVDAFRRLEEEGGAPGWRLHLVGGCDAAGLAYLEQVRAAIGDLPVELHVNCSAAELRELFARASIYWHATGLGEDPEAHPERMEHFGIATVEAMSAGAVPVAIGVAGQLEVFEDGVEGWHFADVDELVRHTAALIADPGRRSTMSDAAVARAARYGEDAFRERLTAMVDALAGGAGAA